MDFGLRRYRQYALGNPKLTILTDHKPLEAIFADSRSGSVRINRIKLRHQDITYKVTWKAGKDNAADFFSRHATPIEQKGPEEQNELT